ncbi:thiamine phosphate synthase [Bacillus tianshenii]|nr:thiamine phosphate synthase [Bacillus tianshenii]
MEFHVITNGKQPFSKARCILQQIEPFIDYIHIREKHLDQHTIETWIEHLKQVNFPLSKVILNTHAEIAATYSLGGVHLPERIENLSAIKKHFPKLTVGASIHSLSSARAKQQADYFMFGHIFETASKENMTPRGVQALHQLCSATTKPIIAIGGISIKNLHQVKASGASGFAMMNGIMEHPEPQKIAKQIHTMIKGWS